MSGSCCANPEQLGEREVRERRIAGAARAAAPRRSSRSSQRALVVRALIAPDDRRPQRLRRSRPAARRRASARTGRRRRSPRRRCRCRSGRSRIALRQARHQSSGSCSAHAGRGDANGACSAVADASSAPSSPTSTAREPPVPTSMPRAGTRQRLAWSCEGVPKEPGTSNPLRYSRVRSLSASLVVDERLRLAVELQLTADAVRDVAQVRQRRRQVAFEDVAGQHLRIVGADRVDEVLIVRGTRCWSGRSVPRVGSRRVGAGPLLVLGPKYDCQLAAALLDPQPALRCRRTGCRSSRCLRRW